MKPNLNSNVLTFVVVFTSVIVWNDISPQVSSAVFLLLDAPHVFPRAAIYFIVSLLPFILLFEVVAKFLFMRTIPSKLAYQSVDLETVSGIDRDALTAYTTNLESLGFIKLTDFQLVEASTGFGRIFSHPNHYCFVEVSQFVGRTTMSCGIISALDKGWTIGTVDRPLSSISATAYAFLRLPRGLGMYKPGATLDQLLQSHLELRQQLAADLQLQVLSDVSAQTFFDLTQRTRTHQKQRLRGKSILFCLVEMLLFSLHPKDEWLGEYAGLAARRQRN